MASKIITDFIKMRQLGTQMRTNEDNFIFDDKDNTITRLNSLIAKALLNEKITSPRMKVEDTADALERIHNDFFNPSVVSTVSNISVDPFRWHVGPQQTSTECSPGGVNLKLG